MHILETHPSARIVILVRTRDPPPAVLGQSLTIPVRRRCCRPDGTRLLRVRGTLGGTALNGQPAAL
ncbi:hypothetical protein OF001_U30232 [Pseudomonas sp. OF001]|nr:hypothetical protein OF001_U30232 [Pseudomonas sp. OF001]